MADGNAYNAYEKTKDSKSKKRRKSCLFADGKSLNILAATTANIIADNFSNEELALLAIFITTIGDNLGTIVAANTLICNGNNENIFIRNTLI